MVGAGKVGGNLFVVGELNEKLLVIWGQWCARSGDVVGRAVVHRRRVTVGRMREKWGGTQGFGGSVEGRGTGRAGGKSAVISGLWRENCGIARAEGVGQSRKMEKSWKGEGAVGRIF